MLLVQSRDLVLVNSVPIIQPDQVVSNGVVHGITRLLLPQSLLKDCDCEKTLAESSTSFSPTELTIPASNDHTSPSTYSTDSSSSSTLSYTTLNEIFSTNSNQFLRRSPHTVGSSENNDLNEGNIISSSQPTDLTTTPFPYFNIWEDLVTNHNLSTSPPQNKSQVNNDPHYFRNQLPNLTTSKPDGDASSLTTKPSSQPTSNSVFGLRNGINAPTTSQSNKTSNSRTLRPTQRPSVANKLTPTVYYADKITTVAYDTLPATFVPPANRTIVPKSTTPSPESENLFNSPRTERPGNEIRRVYVPRPTRPNRPTRPTIPSSRTNVENARINSAQCDPQDISCRTPQPTLDDSFRDQFRPSSHDNRVFESKDNNDFSDSSFVRKPSFDSSNLPSSETVTSNPHQRGPVSSETNTRRYSPKHNTASHEEEGEDVEDVDEKKERTTSVSAFFEFARRDSSRDPFYKEERSTTMMPANFRRSEGTRAFNKEEESSANEEIETTTLSAVSHHPFRRTTTIAPKPKEEEDDEEDDQSIGGIMQDPGLILDNKPISFVVFRDMIRRAGLLPLLSTPNPITIFMPTDEAFSYLSTPEFGQLVRNPNNLKKFILRHFINHPVQPTDMREGLVLTTLSNEPLTLTAIDDGKVSVNGILLELKFNQSILYKFRKCLLVKHLF